MGQRPARIALLFLAALIGVLGCVGAGCDRSSSWPATTARKDGSVASLVPAATEMLIGLGAGDRLVAVSNFDVQREGTRGLPRVGDYQTTDWERLAALRPVSMVTQFAPDRLPPGLVQKSDELGIRLVNVKINRLDDIYTTMETLGQTIGNPAKGRDAVAALKQKLNDVARASAGPRVRALIVLDDSGRGVAGQNNYLDDILTLAGGENVMRGVTTPYPSIDRELLFHLDPEVVFILLPDASAQVRTNAQRIWQSMPRLQAVRNGAVHVYTQWWAQLPTQHVGELAEVFSKAMNAVRADPSRQPPRQSTAQPTGAPTNAAKGKP